MCVLKFFFISVLILSLSFDRRVHLVPFVRPSPGSLPGKRVLQSHSPLSVRLFVLLVDLVRLNQMSIVVDQFVF